MRGLMHAVGQEDRALLRAEPDHIIVIRRAKGLPHGAVIDGLDEIRLAAAIGAGDEGQSLSGLYGFIIQISDMDQTKLFAVHGRSFRSS